MEVKEFLSNIPFYLSEVGKFNDVVLSTRITLRRNIDTYKFVNKADQPQLKEIINCFENFDSLREDFSHFYKADELIADERELLYERNHVGLGFISEPSNKAIMINNEENSGIIINDVEHIKIYYISPGLNFEDSFEKCLGAHLKISKEFKIGFDKEFGYLTASSNYTGSGLTISVLLHIPGLVIAEGIRELSESLTKKRLSILPAFEERDKALGSLFYLRNKQTLGISEEDIIEIVRKNAEDIVKKEYNARAFLMDNLPLEIEDRVKRAYGILTNAKLLEMGECLNLLSAIRLGIGYGIIKGIDIQEINRLQFFTQPFHIRFSSDKKINPTLENQKRATIISNRIGR